MPGVGTLAQGFGRGRPAARTIPVQLPPDEKMEGANSDLVAIAGTIAESCEVRRVCRKN